MADSDEDFPQDRPRKRRVSPFYGFLAIAQARSWKMAFTREKLMETVKTLAWVGPLTILIWVYAEREQIGTQTFSGIVHLTGANLSITPSQTRVSLDLKGPQSNADRIRDQLARGITVELGSAMGRGPQRINVVDRVQNLPLFKDTGVTVTKSEPAEIDVAVDESKTVQVPVQSPPDIPNLEQTTHYEPRTVTVTGPSSILTDQNMPSVYADLRNLDLRKPGHQEQTVELKLSTPNSAISIDPPTVKASVDVRKSDTTKILKFVLIWVAGPPAVLNDYEVRELPVSTGYVTVSGPSDELDLLDKTPQHALLNVSGEDYGHEQPKELEYVLPSDVKVSAADQAKTYSFKLVAKAPRGE